ncbi:MAG: mRNA surveillance protein pelota [Candidatus Micrarchaeaceae archaeon]
MKILKFYRAEGIIKLLPNTLDDLWTMQRVIFENDAVSGKSLRRFRGNESDEGELKEVYITLRVEKTELDKTAQRLKVLGRILDGKPLEYVRLNSYHTLNIAPNDAIEIKKERWPPYLVDVLENAVSDTNRPRLGIIALDEEKALPAYLLGYGIEFRDEIYSRLSKRMSNKDYQDAEKKYFEEIIGVIANMEVNIVIIAGPGFTKDQIKAYMENSGAIKSLGKNIILKNTSNAERSGVYELIKSNEVAELLGKERIRSEFMLMEEFLKGLQLGKSKHGCGNVIKALESYEASTVIVNDSVLGRPDYQRALEAAERMRAKVVVFNSSDEVGQQLASFEDIGCF